MNQVLAPWRKSERTRNELFYNAAFHELARMPYVVSIATMTPTPFRGSLTPMAFFRSSVFSDAQMVTGLPRYASPEAFSVLGMRIVGGRTFSREDVTEQINSANTVGDPPRDFLGAAIVNETAARRFWPNQDPIGKKLWFLGDKKIIGIVADIRESGDNIDIQPTVYFPYQMNGCSFLVRLKPGANRQAFAVAAKSILTGLMPGMPAPIVESLQDLTTKHLANLRLSLTLLSCFSFLGAIVAGLSVYAIASLEVAARMHEMGIRIAMGASVHQIWRLALWRSLRLACAALPVGCFLAWGLARGLSHWLFQVSVVDPVSYSTSAIVLLLITLAAALPPAIKASIADPVTVLRHE
jgi:hypothetical protein